MNSLVLKYSLTIAEEKNMTRARAERPVHIAAVPEPKGVKNLEKELGVGDLFERSQRGGCPHSGGREHYVEGGKADPVRRGEMRSGEIQDISAEKCPADQNSVRRRSEPPTSWDVAIGGETNFKKRYAHTIKSSLRTGRRQSCTKLLDRASLDFIIDNTKNDSRGGGGGGGP